MDLKAFRDKVRYYRRLTAQSQQALAEAIGLHPTVLSAKLNGTDKNHLLTYPEIRRIIQTLAEWEAITRQVEALELLELVNLKLSAFSPAEWATAPLKQLEPLPVAKAMVPQTDKAVVNQPVAVSAAKLPPRPAPPPPEATSIVTTPENDPTPAIPRHNLPAQATPLIGRENETSAVCHLLQRADVRLVTLLGPGGIGKTRLSLRVATDLVEDFANGVVFVPLDTLQDAGLVATALAKTLALKETKTGSLLDSLKTYLHEKHLLMVLDNFEQVSEAANLVADLLAAAPRLKILVTSRSVLKLYGEHQYNVPPLPLPSVATFGQNAIKLEELAGYAAIQLFVQRARAVRPDFKLSTENASAIAKICALLDGIPLAIELVAANCKLFTPPALLARLERKPGQNTRPGGGLLASGTQNLPARQQTLASTLDWSYALLTPPEQQLFARLGVFVGGCTIEAAAEVCQLENEDALDMLSLLTALLDKSMLKHAETAEGEPRFSMLVTLREYALHRLAATPELANLLQTRHAEFFLKLVTEAMAKFNGPERTNWLARLEMEHGNLRAVLEWTLEGDELEPAQRKTGLLLVELIWMFWYVQGYYSEGQYWFNLALAKSDQSDQSLHAKLLHGAGVIALGASDYAGAKAYYGESLLIRRVLGDERGIAALLNNLGNVAQIEGNLADAFALHSESLAVRRKLGNKHDISTSLNNLSIILRKQGQIEAAYQAQEESLELWRNIGYEQGVAHALTNLGIIARQQKDLSKARTLLEEGQQFYQKLGYKDGLASSCGNLGKIARDSGDYDRAQQLFEESLRRYQELGDKAKIAETYANLAEVATIQQNYQAARQLWQQSLKRQREIGNKEHLASCMAGLAQLTSLQKDFIKATTLLSAADKAREGSTAPALEEEQMQADLLVLLKRELTEAEFATAWQTGQDLNAVLNAYLTEA